MASFQIKNFLIIGEFPIIHKGYINFFNRILKKTKKAHFYLGFLDKNIIKEMTKLEPDIRKIPNIELNKIIKTFLPVKKFFIFNKTNFPKLIENIAPFKIIILKGEKSENFAKDYLNNKKYKNIIQYYDVRLKWQEKKVSELKRESSCLSKKELKTHQEFMKKAKILAEGSKCWWRQVGAVLVKDGKVILETLNEMMPFDDECYKIGCVRDEILPGKLSEICSVAHAEAAIIAKAACLAISLKNTTMYVTHFPCPACAKSIALSGVKKLVYSRGSAVFDGEKVLRSRGVEIIKI